MHLHDNNLNKIEKQILFPSFLYSAEVELNNDEILSDCNIIKETYKYSNQRSNVNGWQSPVFNTDLLNNTYSDSDYKHIKKLSDVVLSFCNKISISENLDIKFKKIFWWINYNGKNSYNVIHGHPHTDLVALYYPKFKINNGSLVIVRSDNLHVNLYHKKGCMVRHKIDPKVGKIYIFPAYLLHYVENNYEDEERISLAFNITTF